MQPSDTINTFGAMLKYLRRRARLTQMELGIAVGYTEAHVSRLENNQRLPDLAAIAALFVPALDLRDDAALAARLLELASLARGETKIQATETTATTESIEITGAIESIPELPAYFVPSAVLARLRERVTTERHVALCGLPGMGKTTFAAALAAEFAREQPVFWLTFTEGVTTSVDSVMRQLALFALTQGNDQVVPLLTRNEPHARPLPLDQQLALLQPTLSQRVMLCFDNAHLTLQDAAIVRVFHHLIATTRAQLLLTSREELPLPGIAHVRLDGLARGEAATLLAQLGARLSSAQIERLVRKTGGSPMLLRLASGQLRDERTDVLERIDHLESEPAIATYLLNTVLRSLQTPARRLCELLAIFRQPINLNDETLVELFQPVLRQPARRWSEALAELQRRQLIEHPARAELHPLVRDHIYATLAGDSARRRALHRLAGDWLAGRSEQEVEAAFHYGRANQLQSAAEVLTDRAGDIINRAQAFAAVEVVDELIARARRTKKNATPLRLLLTLRGDLLASTTRANEAEANYREALTLTAQPAPRADIAIRLAQNLSARNRAAEALALTQRTARDLNDSHPLLLAQLAAAEGQAQLTLSKFDDAARAAELARRLAEQFKLAMPSQAAQVQAQAGLTLGIVSNIRGQSQAALDYWQRAIAAARAANWKSIEYRCRANIGIVLYQHGDWAGALENYRAALFGARALADSNVAARVLGNLAILHHLRGELDAALDVAAQMRELKEQMGDSLGVANADNTRASVLLALHRLDEARALSAATVDQVERAGDRRMLGGCLDTLAQILLAQGNVAAARDTLQRALDLPEAQNDASLVKDLRHHRAFALLASGNADAAQRELVDIAASDDPKAFIERKLVEGWIALARGERPAAADCARAARARVEASGYALYQNAAARLADAASAPSPSPLPAALV
jgi:ATP/maltotriose-dependent transcriptional regulator MalT/DNA-binding XRE family transcriptional regulator